ncbi:sodium- and chloride-dependent glycine transporter 2-like [Mytilus edulis]|uniref:sodium- and chloride-dependent glycine transporter 2-like n=1 Tax=Mytilus edulis TaxID=6550 RepID=UPI0039EF4F2D
MAETSRGNWSTWFEFLFSCIGEMVGLGNIWRFPYICFKNGGGAFLVPYLIFMMLLAMPLVFLEFTYAQYSNLGPGKVWLCCPLFKGIGYGMLTLVAISGIYYNVIVAWTLYYFWNSFSYKIPWGDCNNEWNTDNCYMRGQNVNNTFFNTSLLNITTMQINGSDHQYSTNISMLNVSRQTSAEEFWERHVLDMTDGIENQGHLRWQLVLCLLASWTALFFSVLKGIKTSGKVMYVASTIPYVFLLILLIRSLFLPGAFSGLAYFFIPRWSDLLKFSVWSDAAIQVFYSSGLGIGGIITLASYNKFHNNCYRDAMILPVLDTFTSLFAGCVVFSTLGYMAEASKVQIDDVVKQGPGIAFMVYPEALATLPLPQVWSVFFFLMLFTIGLNTMIVQVQVITTGIFDNFPNLVQRGKTLTRLCVCVVGFLLGLMCVTQGGVYILQLIDWYAASVSLMFLLLLEVIVLAWIYTTERLYCDIEMMIGFKPSLIWKFCWRVTCPLIVASLWIINNVQHEPIKYGKKSYPSWAIGVGWIIAIVPLIMIPAGIVQSFLAAKGDLFQRLHSTLKPSPMWKPAKTKGESDENNVELIKLNKSGDTNGANMYGKIDKL